MLGVQIPPGRPTLMEINMRITIDDVHGELTTLPGCTQVVVSHGVFIPKHLKGMGKGKSANKQRKQVAFELGYDYMLCTVDQANKAQVHILESNGWKLLDSFTSSKTENTVLLYGVNT